MEVKLITKKPSTVVNCFILCINSILISFWCNILYLYFVSEKDYKFRISRVLNMTSVILPAVCCCTMQSGAIAYLSHSKTCILLR